MYLLNFSSLHITTQNFPHSSAIGSCFHTFSPSVLCQCSSAVSALCHEEAHSHEMLMRRCELTSLVSPSAAGDRAGDGRVHRRRPDVWSDGGVQQAAGSRLHPARREKPRLLHRNVLGAGHPELTPGRKYSWYREFWCRGGRTGQNTAFTQTSSGSDAVKIR